MQVVEKSASGLSRVIEVIVPATELNEKLDSRIKEVAPQMKLKGFRPGKVPASHVRKTFGRDLMGEIVNATLNESSQKALEDARLRPAAPAEMKLTSDMDKVVAGQADLAYEMSLEVMPDFTPVDPSTLKLERPVYEATDADIEETLKELASQSKSYEDKTGKTVKAADGDQLTIDFVGKIDGEAFDGGAGEDYPLVLGSGSFIPGFEAQLVGAKAGDAVAVEVSFPDSYGAKHLAGKAAVFDCTVKAVKAPKPAEIDDELAKRFGAESLEALTGQVTERLEAEYVSAARAVMKRALLDELDKQVSFDLPPSLVDAEANQIAHQLWHEENPDHHGHDHGAITPTDEHRKLAERRVRLGLLLAEVGRKEKVEVTDAEMTQAVLAQARQYPGQERAFFEFVQKNPQMQQQLRAPIFEDKVVDLIFAGAKVKEKEVSKDALQKAVDALDEL